MAGKRRRSKTSSSSLGDASGNAATAAASSTNQPASSEPESRSSGLDSSKTGLTTVASASKEGRIAEEVKFWNHLLEGLREWSTESPQRSKAWNEIFNLNGDEFTTTKSKVSPVLFLDVIPTPNQEEAAAAKPNSPKETDESTEIPFLSACSVFQDRADLYGYYLDLAVHCLRRLLLSSIRSQSWKIVVSHLAALVGSALEIVDDRASALASLERGSTISTVANPTARHWMARLFVTTVVGALESLRMTSPTAAAAGGGGKTSEIKDSRKSAAVESSASFESSVSGTNSQPMPSVEMRRSMAAASVALERIIRLAVPEIQSRNTSFCDSSASGTPHVLFGEDLSRLWKEMMQEGIQQNVETALRVLVQEMLDSESATQEVGDQATSWNLEKACLVELRGFEPPEQVEQQIESDSQAVEISTEKGDGSDNPSDSSSGAMLAGAKTSKKSGSVGNTTFTLSSVHPIHSKFCYLRRKFPAFQIESRLVFLRWVPVTIDWCAQASTILLPLAQTMLEQWCGNELSLFSATALNSGSNLWVVLEWINRWMKWLVDCAALAGGGMSSSASGMSISGSRTQQQFASLDVYVQPLLRSNAVKSGASSTLLTAVSSTGSSANSGTAMKKRKTKGTMQPILEHCRGLGRTVIDMLAQQPPLELDDFKENSTVKTLQDHEASDETEQSAEMSQKSTEDMETDLTKETEKNQSGDRKPSSPTIQYPPNCAMLVQNLATLASGASASHDSSRKLESLVQHEFAAYCLQNHTRLQEPQLVQYSLRKLHSLLDSDLMEESGDDKSSLDRFIFGGNGSNAGGTKSSGRGKRSKATATTSTSVAAVPPLTLADMSSPNAQAKLLALYLRGFHPELYRAGHGRINDSTAGVLSGKVGANTAASLSAGIGSNLMQYVLEVMEACYDTRRRKTTVLEPNDKDSGLTDSSVPPSARTTDSQATPALSGSKKRQAPTSSNVATATRRSKRRKKETSNTEPVTNTSTPATSPAGAKSNPHSEPYGEYRAISEVRAELASVALEISHAVIDKTRFVLARRFHCLNDSLGAEQIRAVIRLGQMLQTVLLNTRDWEVSLADLDDNSSANFSNTEHKLWAHHMDLCIAVGRGGIDDIGVRLEKTPLTGRRLETFMQVAAASTAVSRDTNQTVAWPLWLTSAQRHLVAENLAHEQAEVEVEADRFIVDGFLGSMKKLLTTPDILAPLNSKSKMEIVADGEIPLSLSDARIYLGAILRLPHEQRIASLEAALDVAHDAFTTWSTCARGSTSNDFPHCNRVFLGFLARVVTTLTYSVIFSFGADEVRQPLMTNLIDGLAPIPACWRTVDGFPIQEQFMGVMGDRESSLLPEMTNLPANLSAPIIGPLHKMLKNAFSLGFDIAASDKGYLLFSAWNALGKTSMWSPITHTVSLAEDPSSDLAEALLVLRNDMCLVHRLIQKEAGESPSSTITRVIDAKGPAPPRALVQNLEQMINRGVTLLDKMVSRFEAEGPLKDIAGISFVLLESLCIYISFAVSSLTKPKNDFVADIFSKFGVKTRGRGYSTESEGQGSENDSGVSQDYRSDALERIEICCKVIGAAPGHPDWLEIGTSLRYGVTRAAAQEFAVKALSVLSRVLRLGKRWSFRSALDVLEDNSCISSRMSELALKLISLDTGTFVAEMSDDRDLANDMATLCNIDQQKIKALVDGLAQAKGAMNVANFVPHSAQRILGHLHGVPFPVDNTETGYAELRVVDEWELCLGACLTAVCPTSRNDVPLLKGKLLSAVLLSSRWERLSMIAMTSLVPCAALARFTTYGKGRKPHPLASIDACVDSYQPSVAHLPEKNPPNSIQSEALSSAVDGCLFLLSSSPLHCGPIAEAIMTNLLVDPAPFSVLQAKAEVGSALDTMATMVDVMEEIAPDATEVTNAIMERLVRVLKYGGYYRSEGSSGLVMFLSDKVEGSRLESISMSQPMGGGSWSPLSFGSHPTSEQGRQLLASLVFVAFGGCDLATRETCRLLVVELGRVASSELIQGENVEVAKSIHDSLVKISPERLILFVQEEICGEERVPQSLASILAAILLSGSDKKQALTIPKMLFETLWKAVLDHGNGNLSEAAMHICFLYGVYCERTEEIVSAIFKDLKKNIRIARSFFFFLRDLCKIVEHEPPKNPPASLSEHNPSLPRSCSYSLREGFFEQHWYNCLTCGLTDEKGCCTLCALVCHRGHEVTYARFSSFFCDCGASAKKDDQNDEMNGACKCLSPLAESELRKAYDFGSTGRSAPEGCDNIQEMSSEDFASVAAKSCKEKAQVAVHGARHLARVSGWAEAVALVLHQESVSWGKVDPVIQDATSSVVSYDSLRTNLHQSHAEKASHVVEENSTLFQASNFSSDVIFSIRAASDSSTERMLRSLIQENSVVRSVIECDSRGHVVVAEMKELIFVSGAAAAAASGGTLSQDLHGITRNLLPVLGSKSYNFESVLGVSVCRRNEKHLVVWGRKEASVFIRDDRTATIETRVDLQLELGMLDGGSDAIVKCRWLPSSENSVIVACGCVLRIFTIRQADETSEGTERAVPAASVVLETGFLLKDFSVVVARKDNRTFWTLYILLSSGSTKSIQLTRKQNGDFEFSSSRISMGDGHDITWPEDIQTVEFLEQSRCLVAGSMTSIFGCFVSETGALGRPFELLSEDEPICQGPFGHWKELGLSRRNNQTCFRFACIGRITENLNYVLLVFQINDSMEVSVSREVLRPQTGCTIDGVAVVSSPCLRHSGENNLLKEFSETLTIIAVSSDGRFCLLHETNGVSTTCTDTVDPEKALASVVPLLAFEKMDRLAMQNVHCNVFGCSGSDILSKLQRDNDSFFLSPHPQGFTMTLSARTEAHDRPVIAGLRFLVGKTSTVNMPTLVRVEGRLLELQEGAKRWYSILLSPIEIAQSQRSGFVTLTFLQPHESSSSIIVDALEVFTTVRDQVEKWLPRCLISLDSRETSPSFGGYPTKTSPDSLLHAVETLSSLGCVVKNLRETVSEEYLVRDLVQRACLGWDQRIVDAVEDLARSFEPDEEACRTILDQARMMAYIGFLLGCTQAEIYENRPRRDNRSFWHGNCVLLEACICGASVIARERPRNYVRAIESSGRGRSIADLSSGPVSESMFVGVDFRPLVTSFVELTLLEMAVAGVIIDDTKSRGVLQNFGPLRGLLTHTSQAVVKLACTAVQDFCRKYSSSRQLEGDFDLFAAQTMAAYYQCDACELMPIRGVRYTFSDDQHPFDLCRKCYDAAMQYAASKSFNEEEEVLIGGRTVGEISMLTCAEVGRMEPVHMQKNARDSASEPEPPIDISEEDSGAEVVHRQQVYDAFLDQLFNGLVSLLTSADRNQTSAPVHLIQLVVELVELSDQKRRVERKKRIAKELWSGLVLSLKAVESERMSLDATNETLDCYVTSLTQLAIADQAARDFLTGKANSIVDESQGQNVVCSLHKEKATCKRGLDSTGKARRFFTCGKDRCNFFCWDPEEGPGCEPNIVLFDSAAAHHTWKLLTTTSPSEGVSLHVKLCDFLNNGFLRHRSKPSPLVAHTKTYEEACRDIADGVLCSKERLGPESSEEFASLSSSFPLQRRVASDSWATLLESCMELLCLTAASEHTDGVKPWFPVLCKILLMEQKASMRALAKTALFRLCGRNSELYFAVRDHYAFGIQLESVIQKAWPYLHEAQIVRERAHQCHDNWKTPIESPWANGGGFELIGTELLIPEDVISRDKVSAIRKVLNELLGSAKKRSSNWRRFCRHASLPLFNLKAGQVEESGLLRSPPLRTLLFLACVLPLDTKIKVLKLIDLGVTQTAGTGTNASLVEPSISGFLDFKDSLFINATDSLTLDVDRISAFIVHHVINGATGDVRRVSGAIAMKLCTSLQPEQVGDCCVRLIYGYLGGVGGLGRASAEFLALIPMIMKLSADFVGKTNELATFVESLWTEQALALRHDCVKEHVLSEARLGINGQKKRFELARCAHCHCSHLATSPVKRTEGRTTRSATREGLTNVPGGSAARTNVASRDTRKQWHLEQVSNFHRGRLDAVKESQTNSEFATFLALKYRLAISEFFVEIHDPRARYVKTITVFSSARQVQDVDTLKSDHYIQKWHTVATLNLARGATRASCALDKPVLAANLKIEYTEFFERPGGSFAADGSILVHCPRCARVVNNAHGVCGNCGEVAFQCRKCRHINYDRLDAFLCVECGYCASGNFVFEISAGIASNAAAITNEREFDRCKQMLQLCSQLRDDIQHCLKDQYSQAVRSVKKISNPRDSKFADDALNKAFFGDFDNTDETISDITSQNIGKQGSVVKALSRPQSSFSSHSSTLKNRYKNVMSLARPTSSISAARRRSRDAIIRYVGHEAKDDDESDFLNLLEANESLARSAGLDPSDPLSRLLASVQSRREQRSDSQESGTSGRREGGEGSFGQGGSGRSERSPKDILDICDRLHVLLREAEREQFQLQRRAVAWHRLNKGDLMDLNPARSSPAIAVAACGTCAGSMASQFLLIWLSLFLSSPETVSSTPRMIRMLLQDETTSKNLQEGKRVALREIALRSETGATLILNSLRMRLEACQDPNAAEILGQIIAAADGSPLGEQFMALATRQLEMNYMG